MVRAMGITALNVGKLEGKNLAPAGQRVAQNPDVISQAIMEIDQELDVVKRETGNGKRKKRLER